MQMIISKSQFKPKVLEYLREVEEKKKTLTITHKGKPVVKVEPFMTKSDEDILKKLKGSVTYYKDPTKPVGLSDWEALK